MKSYLTTKDYAISKEIFELKYDEYYDMLKTFPQPKNLEKYYTSDTYISHTDANKTLTDKLYQTVKTRNIAAKLRIIERHAITKHSILDVGCGTGDFLYFAQKKDWKTVGIEPNPKARTKAQTKGITVHSSIDHLTDEAYDIITLWHVLEHVPDLPNHIKKLKTLLKPSGTLLVAVPNFKSFDASYYKNYWAGFDVPRHLWHFSKNAISKLFKNEHITLIKTYPMLFDAFYVSLLSEEYKTGRKNFLRAFCIGLWSNLKAVWTKEHSSLIYILKIEK